MQLLANKLDLIPNNLKLFTPPTEYFKRPENKEKDKYFRGFPLYEYDEKGKCWLSDPDVLPTKKADFLFQMDMDSYPEGGYELWMWKDGICVLKSFSCYPEYSMIGYLAELGSEDWEVNRAYQEDPWNYSKELNDTSWCAIYESFDDFYTDNLDIASELVSSSLKKKIVGFFHRDLLKYTALSLPNIIWADIEDNNLSYPVIGYPDGYQHWIRLNYGCSTRSSSNEWFDIFYPTKKRNNQRIQIICENNKQRIDLDWNHGKYGLTQTLLKRLYDIK